MPRPIIVLLLTLLALAPATTACSESAPSAAQAADQQPDGGAALRMPAVADNSICLHPSEVDYNHGGKSVLRLKGNQHILLIRFQKPARAPGNAVIRSASLHLHAASGLKLRQVGFSLLNGQWNEGTSSGPAKPGESTYHARAHGTPGWTGPGSTFLDALGQFHYAVVNTEADGWISIELPPAILREIGRRRQFSLAITDEQGQTMANNDFHSRHQNGREPYITARFAPDQQQPQDRPRPSADASDAQSADADRQQAIQRLLRQARQINPGRTNKPSTPTAAPDALEDDVTNAAADADAQPGSFTKAGLSLRITTPYDNVHPISGRSRPPSAADLEGLLWDGSTITLSAARNWFTAFQLVMPVQSPGRIRPLSWQPFVNADGRAEDAISPRTLWVWSIRAEDQDNQPQWQADPLIGSLAHLYFMNLEGQKFQTVYAEIYVPHNVQPGVYTSSLTILPSKYDTADEPEISLPVTLTVHRHTLPDALGYKLSLNTYGSPGGLQGARPGTAQFIRDELDWHRLAHEHRATIAVVPYSQAGQVSPGMAPEVQVDADGQTNINWRLWDERWAAYFSGKAFKNLPRDGQPIDHFFLPMHENWPLPLDENYKWAGPWETHWQREGPLADGLSDRYQTAWQNTAEEFIRHLRRPDWQGTQFHFFLNNKWSFKRGGGKGSSYWDLDEPAYRNDFLALAHFGKQLRQAVGDNPPPNIVYRVDISRPQFERGLLHQTDDLRICNTWRQWPQQAFTRYWATDADQQSPRPDPPVWSYGEPGPPGDPLADLWIWCVEAYAAGCQGMVPWQSLGRQDSWISPRPTSLIYPPRSRMPKKPVTSLRLKALRDAQQDIELLRLLTGEAQGSTNWGTDRARLIMALTGARPYNRNNQAEAPLVTADLSTFAPADIIKLRNTLLNLQP